MESATFREILRLDAQEMIVRQPIALRSRARRAPDERVFLRLPSVVALACRVVWRLSPRSRVRQAFIRRGAQLGFDALNRGDFRSRFFVLYDPNVEFITPPRLVGLGFDPVYHGREGRVRFQKRWMDEWGEMRFEPEEVFDLGDGLLFLGRVEGSGVSSGAAFASEQWGVLYEASAGRVIREEPFFDRREALEAAGLHE